MTLWYVCNKPCPTHCNTMDCSLPGSSVHGILQARVLMWVAISFCRGSLPPRDQTHVSAEPPNRKYIFGLFSQLLAQDFYFKSLGLPEWSGWEEHLLCYRMSPFQPKFILVRWLLVAPLNQPQDGSWLPEEPTTSLKVWDSQPNSPTFRGGTGTGDWLNY